MNLLSPTVITDDCKQPIARVADGDSIIFMNFRPDRARQITRSFVDDDFSGFQRGTGGPKVHFVCLTVYDKTIKTPVPFPPTQLVHTLGEVVRQAYVKTPALKDGRTYERHHST